MLRGLLAALTAGWELYALAVVSETGAGFLDVALTIPLACLLALAWPLAWSATSPGWKPAARRFMLWASFPVLGAALVMIYLSSQSPSNPLFRLRFLASQGALTRAAQGLESGSVRPAPMRVGLFRTTYAPDLFPDEVRFLTADCGVVDRCGLAYRPRSRPTGSRYAHIAGPWYLIYEPF